MRTEFSRQKIVSALLIALAVVASLVIREPALAQPPTLNGNVELDFTGSDVLIINDLTDDVGMPTTSIAIPGPTGWDMKDLRLFYHAGTDTMYVGINVISILGDADGDGDPSVTSTYLGYPSPPGLGGTDVPNLGGSERAAVYFDLDQDGTWDVIAGISGVADYSGFSVNDVTYPFSAAYSFGMPLLGNAGNISANPDAGHPDLEFTITNWSALDASPGFTVGAHVGSEDDAGIGEDYLGPASFGPLIDVEKLVSKDNVNFVDADSATSALDVIAGNSVYFKYIVTNTGNVTLTNITLSDDTHDVSGITLTDPLAPLASFNGTIGPITALPGLQTDVATATGDWGGFTVQDTDPANYLGGAPLIDIEKYVSVDNGVTWLDADSAPGPTALVGSNVSFYVSVCNNGTANLTNILVSDTDFTFTGVVTSLVPGACSNSTIVTTTAVAGQQWDVANVTAQADGIPVFDEDPAYYNGAIGSIDIEKYVSVDNGATWLDADSAPGPTALVGNNVSFYVSVCNNGTANLTNILVSDTDFTFTGVVTSLTPGACDNSTIVTTTAVAGQQWDVANVTAQADGLPVFDEDPANYNGATSIIDIEKYVSVDNGVTWLDADSAPGPTALVGNNVSFYVSVCNVGTANLTNILVSDTDFTFSGIVTSLTPGACDNSTIVTGTAVAGQQWDVANVTAQADGIPVFDEDPAYYFGSVPIPAIDIEKHTNGVDADAAPGPYISVNSSVNWTYIVTNTGAVNLTDIVVTDDKLGPIGAIPSLAVNASQTLYAYGTAIAGQYANNASVIGYYGTVNVTDWDPSHYYNRPTTVGWESYPVNKARVLLPWIGLLGIIMIGASLLVRRHRRVQS